jgi:four helix bundle protein
MDQRKTTGIVSSFRDLVVWQRSMDLNVLVYRITQSFPREETYGLASQLRRSAISILSNIAEGQGRLNADEFRQFLGIARGSTCEVQTQLELARRLDLGDPRLLDQAEALSHEIGRMIFTILGTQGMTSSLPEHRLLFTAHCPPFTIHSGVQE